MKGIWTLENALPIIRLIAPVARAHGFGVALRGSVLEKGESAKDLDLFFTVEQPDTTLMHVRDLAEAIAELPEIRTCGEISGGTRPYCVIWLKNGLHIDAQFDLVDS